MFSGRTTDAAHTGPCVAAAPSKRRACCACARVVASVASLPHGALAAEDGAQAAEGLLRGAGAGSGHMRTAAHRRGGAVGRSRSEQHHHGDGVVPQQLRQQLVHQAPHHVVEVDAAPVLADLSVRG